MLWGLWGWSRCCCSVPQHPSGIFARAFSSLKCKIHPGLSSECHPHPVLPLPCREGQTPVGCRVCGVRLGNTGMGMCGVLVAFSFTPPGLWQLLLRVWGRGHSSASLGCGISACEPRQTQSAVHRPPSLPPQLISAWPWAAPSLLSAAVGGSHPRTTAKAN